MSHRDVALFWRCATVSTKIVSPARHWTRPPGVRSVKVIPSKEYRVMSAVAISMSFAVQFRSLGLAWPGLIGGLSFFALNLMDRFFIKHYHGLTANGLY